MGACRAMTNKLQLVVLSVACVVACTTMAFGASFDCIMEPTQMVEVSSPVTGLLDKVHVARGDKVTKGQVLASLESRAEH